MAYYRRTRRSGRRSRYSRPNRRLVWVRSWNTGVPASGSAGGHPIDLLLGANIDRGAVVGSTVVRSRIDVALTGGVLTGAYASVVAGLYVGRNEVPLAEPYADMNKVDWMYWRWINVSHPDFGSYAIATAESNSFSVDVKSQRVIATPQETLIFNVQQVNWESATQPTFHVAASVLLKLQ